MSLVASINPRPKPALPRPSAPEWCECENCHHRGALALYRSPVPLHQSGHGYDPFAIATCAIVLCVRCADRSGFPRWFAP